MYHRNITKKLLCIVCIIVLLFSNTTAVIANDALVISVGQVSAQLGEQVTIPVTLEYNPGIAGLILVVEYDSSKLSIDNAAAVSRGTALSQFMYTGLIEESYNQNPFKLVWFGLTDDTSTGTLVDITFTVLQSAPQGEALFTVSRDDAFNINDKSFDVSVKQGSINILAEESNDIPVITPTPSISPTPNATPSITPAPNATPLPTPETTLTPSPSPQNPIIDRNFPLPEITPRPVYIPSLPPAIQETVKDNQVFTADIPDTNDESVRMMMSIPFERQADIMPETIVAYHVDTDGKISLIIPSLYNEAHSHIRFLGYTGELYMGATNPINFTDVSHEKWYHNAISFVAARELFVGVGNNLFAPQSTMTRAMFITALSNLEYVDTELYHTSHFIDVNIEDWYGVPVMWAMQEGIIDYGILSNDTVNTFRPNDNITREEMAVIFAKYLAARDFPLTYSDTPLFYDLDQASPWAREAIQDMRNHSIINGTGGNLYNPKGYATRAEVAQIFTNLIKSVIGVG